MTKDQAFKIIEEADFIPKNNREKVYVQLINIVKSKTDNFKEIENISNNKIDMLPILQEKGISKEEYEKEFQSIKRSEFDVVLNLVENIKKITNKKATSKSEKTIIEENISELNDLLSILDDKKEIKLIKQNINELEELLSIL